MRAAGTGGTPMIVARPYIGTARNYVITAGSRSSLEGERVSAADGWAGGPFKIFVRSPFSLRL